MFNVWFIDDDENFIDAMKRCLGIDIDANEGIFNQRIRVKFLDPGIDGSSIINIINNAKHKSSSIAPDVIFLDLRYPIDKRRAMTVTSNSTIDPLKLSGIKVLEAISKNDIFDSCYPIIFSEVSLNQTNKDEIINNYNYRERSMRFIEKNPMLHDITLDIDGVNSYIATKNCDSMKTMIKIFEKN